MGDAVTIRFLLRGEEAVADRRPYLRSHWGGDGFRDLALSYAQGLCRDRKGERYPLDRMEPGTVLVDFLRIVLEQHGRGPVERDLCLSAGDPALDDSRHYDVVLPGPGGKPDDVQLVPLFEEEDEPGE